MSSLTISKMVFLFILSTNVKENLLVLNWKDEIWENFEVTEIYSYLDAEEPSISSEYTIIINSLY